MGLLPTWSRGHALTVRRGYPQTMHWRFFRTPPLAGTANMGIDRALMDRARETGEGVVRVYEWRTPTISLGRNQTAIGHYDADLANAAGLDVLRRQTGGRAVLHHREITYAVVAPCDHDESLRMQYNTINEALVRALRTLTVDARIVERTMRMPKPGGAPCFEMPAPGEIAVGDAKLVGSAQLREDGAFLQHGSILVHDDQGLLEHASLRPGLPTALAPVATLHGTLGRDVAAAELADVLFSIVSDSWDKTATPLNKGEMDAVMRVAQDAEVLYLSPEWTWRR